MVINHSSNRSNSSNKNSTNTIIGTIVRMIILISLAGPLLTLYGTIVVFGTSPLLVWGLGIKRRMDRGP